MTEVRLTGQLLCSTREEIDVVQAELPDHIEATLAESGCLEFRVEPTDDPFVWEVSERFVDADAFRAHQRRVAASDWGRDTASIERRYVVDGL